MKSKDGSKKGFSFFKVLGGLATVAIIAGVSIFGYKEYLKRNSKDIANLQDGWIETEVTETDTTETIFSDITRELKASGDLVTYKQDYDGHVAKENMKNGPVTGHAYSITKNRVAFDYKGRISVAYDFDQIDYELRGNKIIVSVPSPYIYENYAEALNVEEKDNILNDAKGGEVITRELNKAKEIELKKAENGGIYDLAEAELKTKLEEQFAELVFKTKLVNN